MGNNIELFEKYIEDKLSPKEKREFFDRVKSDKDFARDLRIYLLSVRGVCLEVEQDNIEFATAMKHLSDKDLLRIIGRIPRRPLPRAKTEYSSESDSHYAQEESYIRHSSVTEQTRHEPVETDSAIRYSSVTEQAPIEPTESDSGIRYRMVSQQPVVRKSSFIKSNWGWLSSIAALIIVGFFAVINVQKAESYKVDDLIVAYNYIPDSNRGGEPLTADDIPSLREAYENAPTEDIQLKQEAGMRLAMAYLKNHDRKHAKELLSILANRFADDEEFAAQCNKILDQLK